MRSERTASTAANAMPYFCPSVARDAANFERALISPGDEIGPLDVLSSGQEGRVVHCVDPCMNKNDGGAVAPMVDGDVNATLDSARRASPKWPDRRIAILTPA